MNNQHILVVEDDHTLRSALSDTLSFAGYQTCLAESGEQAMTMCHHHDFDAVISDINLPGMDGHTLMSKVQKQKPDTPVILMTGYADTEKAVAAMKAGASDYLVKPFPPARLIRQLKTVVPERHSDDWIAEAPASKHIKELAARVACTDTSVLLTGESGTGKEVLARYIHSNSSRQDKPFIAINCAALPETMMESLLFGHEKGAFTGANSRHQGKFEQAHGGTLFLDEIAEMPLPQQAKLLRVIQEREVERLGSQSPTAVNVRIIAATNRDLSKEILAGNFREDLFYRLNVFPLHIPALRERTEDISLLSMRLLHRHTYGRKDLPKDFTQNALNSLIGYEWPGNIRELDNVIQRACVICPDKLITANDLLLPSDSPNQGKMESALPVSEAHLQIDALPMNAHKRAEYKTTLKILAENHGHRGDTAEALGITTRMLRYKIAKLRDLGVTV